MFLFLFVFVFVLVLPPLKGSSWRGGKGKGIGIGIAVVCGYYSTNGESETLSKPVRGLVNRELDPTLKLQHSLSTQHFYFIFYLVPQFPRYISTRPFSHAICTGGLTRHYQLPIPTGPPSGPCPLPTLQVAERPESC